MGGGSGCGEGRWGFRPRHSVFQASVSSLAAGSPTIGTETQIFTRLPICKEDIVVGRNVQVLEAPFSPLPTWRALIWQKNKPFLFMSLQTSCLPSLPAS